MQHLGQALREAVENMTPSLSDEYVCPICNRVVPPKKLLVLGVEKIVQPRCKCEVQAWENGVAEAIERKAKNDMESRFSFSGMGERFHDSKFSTFIIRPGAEKAAEMALGYAKHFGDYGGDSLLIWGQPGNGKSHLAAAICHEIREQGYFPIFQTMTKLLERIRGTFRKNSNEHENEIMDALQRCDLLVLDDLGAEKISDWTLDVLFRIIDGRYSRKKPTLFTTNFSPNELLHRFMPERPEKEDEIAAKRILDRIIEISVIVENKATSYRLEVAKAKRNPDPRRQWA